MITRSIRIIGLLFFLSAIFLRMLGVSAVAENVGEEDVFKVASTAYHEGEYETASRLLKHFVSLYPYSKYYQEAQIYRADCLLQEDNFTTAREILTQLEKSYVPYTLEAQLQFLLGQVYEKVRDYKSAKQYYRKVLSDHPESALHGQAQLHMAKIAIEQNDYKQALSLYAELIEHGTGAVLADALFERGVLYYQTKEYQPLIDNFLVFVETFPASKQLGYAYFYLAEGNFYLGDFAKAIKYYNQALEKNDDDEALAASAAQGLSWAYLKSRQFDEAQTMLTQLASFPAQFVDQNGYLLAQAVLADQRKQFTQSLRHYDALLSIAQDPQSRTQALFGRARALRELGRSSEAAKAYKEFILKTINTPLAIDSQIAQAYYELGTLALNEGQVEEALQSFERAVERTDDIQIKTNAYLQIADAYFQLNDHEKAISYYRKLINEMQNEQYADYIYFRLGVALVAHNNIDDAIKTFEFFNTRFSDSDYLDDVNYYLGYALMQSKKYPAAIAQLENFLDIFEDSVFRKDAALLLVTALEQTGARRSLLKIVDEMLAEFQHDQELVERLSYKKAQTFIAMGKEDRAAATFKDFLSNYPKSPLAASLEFWLGQYYYRTGEFELARKYFESIIRSYPHHQLQDEAYFQIAQTFWAQGRLDEAIQSFRRIIEQDMQEAVKVRSFLALADIFFALDRPQEALSVYDELTRTYSSDMMEQESPEVLSALGSAYLAQAEYYRKNRDFEKALVAYRQALRYTVQEPQAKLYFEIAECLEESGDTVAAQEAYESIEVHVPGDTEWQARGLLRSASLYEHEGKLSQAIALYERVVQLKIPESKFACEKIETLQKHASSVDIHNS